MDCRDFQVQSHVFSKLPLARDVWDSEEYEEWAEHLQSCDSCEEWLQKEKLRARGIDPSEYPCVHMAAHVTADCEEHPDPWDCPDRIIVQLGPGEYAIPIRDGGRSGIALKYCPWCATPLTAGLST